MLSHALKECMQKVAYFWKCRENMEKSKWGSYRHLTMNTPNKIKSSQRHAVFDVHQQYWPVKRGDTSANALLKLFTLTAFSFFAFVWLRKFPNCNLHVPIKLPGNRTDEKQQSQQASINLLWCGRNRFKFSIISMPFGIFLLFHRIFFFLSRLFRLREPNEVTDFNYLAH